MRFKNKVVMLAATLAMTGVVPGSAIAQQRGTQASRSENVRATVDLRTRISAAERRITEGQRSGKVTRARATALRRQITQTQASMTRLSREQGFVSAAELASYNRTMRAVDIALDRLGVARSYGNGMLVATDAGGRDDGFRYDCQNEPIAIAIPADRLDAALGRLRLVTHCPISGTELARGKRSGPVVGTMTPAAAMQAMLDGTGLQVHTLKGGFQVVRLPRR